jgi:hypothetical protein
MILKTQYIGLGNTLKEQDCWGGGDWWVSNKDVDLEKVYQSCQIWSFFFLCSFTVHDILILKSALNASLDDITQYAQSLACSL